MCIHTYLYLQINDNIVYRENQKQCHIGEIEIQQTLMSKDDAALDPRTSH